MSQNDQIFSDGIGTISVTGTVVRLDFVALSPTERDASGNPKMEHAHRVIMPVDAFVRSVAKLQETVQALVDRGVVRPASTPSPIAAEIRPPAPPEKAKVNADAPPPDKSQPGLPKSPSVPFP